MYDVIIVGGGPAGLSAAAALARLRRSVLLIDAGEQRNLRGHAVDNYLGLEGISPRELLRRGRAEAKQAGAELREGRVTEIRRRADGFTVELERGGSPELMARRIVLATSLVDVTPDIEGFEAFYGMTVVHCPICDAATFTDRPIVALSWGRKAADYALELRQWTEQLTLATHDHPIEDDQRRRLERQGVSVRTEPVERLEGQAGRLTGVALEGGDIIPCDAVFFNIAHRPRNELARGLGCRLAEDGFVQVSATYQTTVPGVYAAGDITVREESVADAVAEGFIAACNINTSLYPRW